MHGFLGNIQRSAFLQFGQSRFSICYLLRCETPTWRVAKMEPHEHRIEWLNDRGSQEEKALLKLKGLVLHICWADVWEKNHFLCFSFDILWLWGNTTCTDSTEGSHEKMRMKAMLGWRKRPLVQPIPAFSTGQQNRGKMLLITHVDDTSFSCLLLYARVLFFCEVNNNKNAKEYLCLGLLW